jgi:hypothetical protein
LIPSGEDLGEVAARCESTEDSRWSIEAFSKASEVWVVGFVVYASFLQEKEPQ